MKCSVVSMPKFIVKDGKKTALKMSTCNVWIELKGLPGHLIMPCDLTAFPDKNTGKWRAPMINHGQPIYTKNVDGKKQRRVSYFSAHLDGEAAQKLESIVLTDWLKKEAGLALKAKKGDMSVAREFEWDEKKEAWKFVAERPVVASDMSAEDSEMLGDFATVADEFAAKAVAAAGTAPESKSSADQANTVLGVLGVDKQ